MTSPAVTAARVVAGMGLGLALGVLWDLLKPLSRRHPHLSDLLFLPALIWAWLELGFGICGGDLRLGCTASLGLGWAAWELTLGRLLTPAVTAIWDFLGAFFLGLLAPFRKIAKNFLH